MISDSNRFYAVSSDSTLNQDEVVEASRHIRKLVTQDRELNSRASLMEGLIDLKVLRELKEQNPEDWYEKVPEDDAKNLFDKVKAYLDESPIFKELQSRQDVIMTFPSRWGDTYIHADENSSEQLMWSFPAEGCRAYISLKQIHLLYVHLEQNLERLPEYLTKALMDHYGVWPQVCLERETFGG